MWARIPLMEVHDTTGGQSGQSRQDRNILDSIGLFAMVL